MQNTPKAQQLHIGLFGKCNVGKSTLMNGLLGQEISIVSPVVGTTTDHVEKSIEWHPLGPVVVIDTGGIDDTSELGELRVHKTRQVFGQVDLAIWILDEELTTEEKKWIKEMRKFQLPYLFVYNQKQQGNGTEVQKLKDVITCDFHNQSDVQALKKRITQALKGVEEPLCIGDCLSEGEVVLLVTPQDQQAPKGRLILPQVKVVREILDKKAIPIMTTPNTLKRTLELLGEPPSWVITDSQVFKMVEKCLPKESKLTSFSILMARAKGDLEAYQQGVEAISALEDGDCLLIAESCTHNPLHQDIAREKIPCAIQKKTGKRLAFEWVSGKNFPEDLSKYRLIIQCGGCMHTPRQIQYRIACAKTQGVPITNFGVLLAALTGVVWERMSNL